MTTLHEAESALAAARQRRQDAYQALTEARARVPEIEARIRGGETVPPSELVAAKGAVEHAELVHAGTEEQHRQAEEVAQAARAEQVCDEILAVLRARGSDVVLAIEALERPLAVFVDAAGRYEGAVRDASNLAAAAQASPRWEFHHYGANRVDGVKLESCRPMAQLARLLRPFVADLGVPSHVRDDFKLLAEGAPELPVEHQ